MLQAPDPAQREVQKSTLLGLRAQEDPNLWGLGLPKSPHWHVEGCDTDLDALKAQT